MSSPRFEVFRGDITTLAVDAVVNAADRLLLGGGGVDGAIHRAAGPELLKYCRKLKGCLPGQAKLTPGFYLPAKHIIHTVGPIWMGGLGSEAETLASCYRNCIAIAHEQKFESIAFPALATGIYHYPADQAAEIAIATCHAAFPALDRLQRIIFVCFDTKMESIYRKKLAGFGLLG